IVKLALDLWGYQHVRRANAKEGKNKLLQLDGSPDAAKCSRRCCCNSKNLMMLLRKMIQQVLHGCRKAAIVFRTNENESLGLKHLLCQFPDLIGGLFNGCEYLL